MKTYTQFKNINESYVKLSLSDFFKKIEIKTIQDFNKNKIIQNYFYQKPMGKYVGWILSLEPISKEILLTVIGDKTMNKYKFISTDFTIDSLTKDNAHNFVEPVITTSIQN